MLLAHLRRCDLAEIDGIGGIVGTWPDGSVLQDFLKRGFGFCKFLLGQITIADVAIGKKKELVLGHVEGRFLSERNDFGPVPLDDFRRASAFSLLLSYRLVCIVELSLFDFFRREFRYYLDGIMPCWL